MDSYLTLPIGGIVRKMPYERKTDKLVCISHMYEMSPTSDYLLIPKRGKGKALLRSVQETLRISDPTNINASNSIHYAIDFINYIPRQIENVYSGSLILGFVSLLICAISILSSITFDTRYRKKEVAIRKVNGAKRKDIYKLFGSVYGVLIIVSAIIAVPVSILFSRWVSDYVCGIFPEISFSPVMPIIFGISIVFLLIFAIVGWQIYRVMQVDPAKIIAKE